MSPTIPFCLMMSILAAAKSTTNAYRIAVESHSSSSTERENLKIILNYVQSKQTFYPSIFSLVSSDVRSNFVDFVSKYVASESIVSYKITMNDLSRRYTWQNRIDLTWIFIVDDINVLKFFVRERSYIWKTTNQYLVIITAPIPLVSSREIFQTIWKTYNVYRIVFVSIQDDFRCLSRYLPFERNLQNEYGAVRKICLMKQTNNIELYTNFENLNGYPIRVIVFGSLTMNFMFDKGTRTYKYKGLDADAMFLLEKSMGAQFRINVFSTNFTKGKIDPFHRSLQYIEDGKSDIIINGFFIYDYQKYRSYEFTASVYEDKMCLIAPTTGFIPKSYMPIMPFAPDLWTALAIYNILVSILWFLIKYYSGSFRRQETVLLPLMRTEFVLPRQSSLPPRIHPYVSSCFDLVETSCYPLKEDGGSGSTTAQRVFLLGTLFFGLIVVGLYQSYLVSVLSNPFHYPELNTLEDVANSNLTLATKYYNLKEHAFTENTTLAKKLRSKIKVIVSDKPTIDMVAFGKNKVIAITRYTSLKIDDLSQYYDADGNELLHLVEECPSTYSLSYVIRLHSPYRERINGLLLRMQEAGLINLWYENMAYPTYVAEQKRKVEKSERRMKLTMKHYSLTFVGLSVGLLFCVVVFLAELYFAKKSQSHTRAETVLKLISKN
ncbi:uncharacterized protein LOC115246111 [Formica exsecta]|uniref:uncharacterized protein LOC115246111 n=1 Tax=Formica exsecta TaxID=72781 RepID=UPI0011425CF7|nr:uncharacterized protein LOC115246111 [Formica exsecta]XP_029680587.1 uncharacterized protein LOC115246111 [Formica exsecta]XP_029680588.1 uncharacterized protein LOC115246111 [Formica exsecta]XP_029680590.1 uncharacterized protein LOC115246111 [Formica exsecta]